MLTRKLKKKRLPFKDNAILKNFLSFSDDEKRLLFIVLLNYTEFDAVTSYEVSIEQWVQNGGDPQKIRPALDLIFDRAYSYKEQYNDSILYCKARFVPCCSVSATTNVVGLNFGVSFIPFLEKLSRFVLMHKDFNSIRTLKLLT